jgi:hypothetical protein
MENVMKRVISTIFTHIVFAEIFSVVWLTRFADAFRNALLGNIFMPEELMMPVKIKVVDDRETILSRNRRFGGQTELNPWKYDYH